MFRPRPSDQGYQERQGGTKYQKEWIQAKERRTWGKMEIYEWGRERSQTKDWWSSAASWQYWEVQRRINKGILGWSSI